VPSFRIRRAIYKAVKRGVKVTLILPYTSDLIIMDIIRNRYIARLYRKGVMIYFYMPRVLHTKLMIIDDSFFILGSSNLDYRSFIHQCEINLFGKNKKIIKRLTEYFNETLKQSKPFSYTGWKKRRSIIKIIEKVLYLFRRYL